MGSSEKPFIFLQPSLMRMELCPSFLFHSHCPVPCLTKIITKHCGFPYFESASPMAAAGFIFKTMELIVFPSCSKTPDVSHCLQSKTQACKTLHLPGYYFPTTLPLGGAAAQSPGPPVMSPFSSEGEDHTYPSSPMPTRPLLPPEKTGRPHTDPGGISPPQRKVTRVFPEPLR